MVTVTLCGSAKFEQNYKQVMKLLTKAGYVVVGLGSYPSENGGDKDWYGPVDKEVFDLVHLEKVRMADAVLVVDSGLCIDDGQPWLHGPAYIGFSTAREILYANMVDRPVMLLSSMTGPGHLIESIENRWDESFNHSKSALAMAAERLKQHFEDVARNDGECAAQFTNMYAGLSILACVGGTVGEFAEKVLTAASLDPMDVIPPEQAEKMPMRWGVGVPEAAFSGFADAPEPAEESQAEYGVTSVTYQSNTGSGNGGGGHGEAFREPVAPQSDRSFLNGELSMARRIHSQLVAKPKHRRHEIVVELAKTIDGLSAQLG